MAVFEIPQEMWILICFFWSKYGSGSPIWAQILSFLVVTGIGYICSAVVPEKLIADVVHLHCWKSVSPLQEEYAHAYMWLLGQGLDPAVIGW